MSEEDKKFPQQCPELMPIFRYCIFGKWLNVYLIKGCKSMYRYRLYLNKDTIPVPTDYNSFEVVNLLNFLTIHDPTPFNYEIHPEAEVLQEDKIDPDLKLFLKEEKIFGQLVLVSDEVHAQHVLDEVVSEDCKFCCLPSENN